MEILDLSDPRKNRQTAEELLAMNLTTITFGFRNIMLAGDRPDDYVVVVVAGDVNSQENMHRNFPNVEQTPGQTVIFCLKHSDFLAEFAPGIREKGSADQPFDLEQRRGSVLIWVVSAGKSFFPRIEFSLRPTVPLA
jgi:hypothetical protein